MNLGTDTPTVVAKDNYQTKLLRESGETTAPNLGKGSCLTIKLKTYVSDLIVNGLPPNHLDSGTLASLKIRFGDDAVQMLGNLLVELIVKELTGKEND